MQKYFTLLNTNIPETLLMNNYKRQHSKSSSENLPPYKRPTLSKTAAPLLPQVCHSVMNQHFFIWHGVVITFDALMQTSNLSGLETSNRSTPAGDLLRQVVHGLLKLTWMRNKWEYLSCHTNYLHVILHYIYESLSPHALSILVTPSENLNSFTSATSCLYVSATVTKPHITVGLTNML